MINSHPLCLLSYRGTEQLAVAGMCLGDLGGRVKRFLRVWENFYGREEGRGKGGALAEGEVVRSTRERSARGVALMRGSYAEGEEGGPAFRVRAASTRLSCRVACLHVRLQGRTLSGLVTGIRSAEQFSRKYVPESWKTCRFSAAALRAVRSKRHPSMPFAWVRRAPRSIGPLRSLSC